MSSAVPLSLPLLACIALFLLIGVGPNIELAFLATIVLLTGIALLRRPGEPPVLLFAFVFHWLQASVAVFYANLIGVPQGNLLNGLTTSSDRATALSLVALGVITFGIRLSTGGPNPSVALEARAFLARASIEDWFKVYLGAVALSIAATSGAGLVPGLSQVLLALANFKWAAFMLFTMVAFSGPARYLFYWLAVFCIEFVLSLGGFFSNFKDVFIYAVLALAFTGKRRSASQFLVGGILAVVAVALSIIWTAIKVDYRHFVSGGNYDQSVVVSRQASIAKIFELVGQLDVDELESAITTSIRRLSYVEFFGAATEFVPNHIPHENGALWIDAISRPFMPRILFPEKSELHDSALTKKYTGLKIAGQEQGTSISIGYIGESYIDFGEYLMFGPLLLAGILTGRVYRWLCMQAGLGPVVGPCMATVLIMSVSKLETSLAKSVGAFMAIYLVSWLFSSVIVKHIPRRFLQGG